MADRDLDVADHIDSLGVDQVDIFRTGINALAFAEAQPYGVRRLVTPSYR